MDKSQLCGYLPTLQALIKMTFLRTRKGKAPSAVTNVYLDISIKRHLPIKDHLPFIDGHLHKKNRKCPALSCLCTELGTHPVERLLYNCALVVHSLNYLCNQNDWIKHLFASAQMSKSSFVCGTILACLVCRLPGTLHLGWGLSCHRQPLRSPHQGKGSV